MQYNTELEPLKLPEFGRHIHKMVEHCLTIHNRQERQSCAETIVDVMARIYPDAANKKENNPTLWNQLAALSDYKLDIDYPVEIVSPDELNRRPAMIDYPEEDIIYRHYGHITQELIARASTMPRGEQRNKFIELIAKHMRNTFLTWGHSNTDNERIIKDLKALSNGELEFDEEELLDVLDDSQAVSLMGKDKQKARRKR